MNSLYGVLAATSCRFFSPAIANAITLTGQCLIHLAADEMRRLGRPSSTATPIPFSSPWGKPSPPRRSARRDLRGAIAAMLVERLQREFGVESHLELEYEKCYRRFFMPEVRQGTGGSKKRYAGLVANGEADRLEFVGLEAVVAIGHARQAVPTRAAR